MASAPQGRLAEAGRGEGGGQSQGRFGGWINQGKLRRWRCGIAGRLESGPQGEEEVLYLKGEREVSCRSVGSVRGPAELSSVRHLPQGPGRYKVEMDLAVQNTDQSMKNYKLKNYNTFICIFCGAIRVDTLTVAYKILGCLKWVGQRKHQQWCKVTSYIY